MRKTLVYASLIIIAACSPKVVPISSSDVERGASKYAGTTLATLTEGKTLYEANCAACHPLKSPSSKDETGWNQIVPNMVQQVNKKEGKQVLDAQKEQLILKYLVTMGSAPKK